MVVVVVVVVVFGYETAHELRFPSSALRQAGRQAGKHAPEREERVTISPWTHFSRAAPPRDA
jgi:hypothetical protein